MAFAATPLDGREVATSNTTQVVTGIMTMSATTLPRVCVRDECPLLGRLRATILACPLAGHLRYGRRFRYIYDLYPSRVSQIAFIDKLGVRAPPFARGFSSSPPRPLRGSPGRCLPPDPRQQGARVDRVDKGGPPDTSQPLGAER